MELEQNRIFIVEGPDGTGKTTLCNALSKAYNIPVYHLTYYADPKKHAEQFEYYAEMLNDAIARNESGYNGFILDRFIMSDVAYANVYRNGEYVENYEKCMGSLKDACKFANATLIFALPHDKVRYIENFKRICDEREEMYPPDKMLRVYNEFESLYESFSGSQDWEFRFNNIGKFNIVRFDFFNQLDKEKKD